MFEQKKLDLDKMLEEIPIITKKLTPELTITNAIEDKIRMEKQLIDLINESFFPFYSCMQKEPEKYVRMNYEPENCLLQYMEKNEIFCLYYGEEYKLIGCIRFSIPTNLKNPNTSKFELSSYLGLLGIDLDYTKRGFSNLVLNFCKDLFLKLKDQNNVERLTLLTLTPVTTDELPTDFLKAWYKKHGFVSNFKEDAMKNELRGAMFKETFKYDQLEYEEFEFRAY